MNLAFNIELDKFNINLAAIASLIHINKSLKEKYETRLRNQASAFLGKVQNLVVSAKSVVLSLAGSIEGDYGSYVENLSQFKSSFESAMTPELEAMENSVLGALRGFTTDLNKASLLTAVNNARNRFLGSALVTTVNEAPYQTQIQVKDAISGVLSEIQDFAS